MDADAATTSIEAWRGLRNLRKEIVSDHIMVEGKMEFCSALPDWLCGSALGSFERSHPDQSVTSTAQVIRLLRNKHALDDWQEVSSYFRAKE